MAHFCGFIKLIFLLLMLEGMLGSAQTKPLKSRTVASSDLISGNEFLKLFMGHEEQDHEFYNRHQINGGGEVAANVKDSEEFDKKSAETGRTRLGASRSLKVKASQRNRAEGQAEDSKQLAKVKTDGKIGFPEDYDENDAILEAEARDIDLKRQNYKGKDDYKVVSVSVSSSSSSSSQRGLNATRNRLAATTSKYDNKSYTSTKSIVTMTPRPPTATTYKPLSSTSIAAKSKTAAAAATTLTGDNFINRSQKSEFAIEEVQPSAAKQQQQQQYNNQQPLRKPQQYKSRKQYTRHRTYPITSVADTLEALDSENSASTNIQNVLASPLQSAASLRSTSTITSTYHSGQRNLSINHDTSNLHKALDDISKDIDDQQQQQAATGIDDQLLPFQTVIYHDTKDGRGPQSRSISYSSLSQNVEDLKKWHQSGILAEARRNVSESLKSLQPGHQSEPSKFYSQPSKMYSEPSKFYSEPSKVYSEPSKNYGEPEKFYSEPAKVYGQPSKFYSEPSKVYSQPSKVYGEPAKTYWPVAGTTSTTTTKPLTLAPTSKSAQITTTPSAANIFPASRKPAIVSRIAFGEGHSSSSSTSTSTTSTTTTTTTSTTTTKKPFSSYHHQHNHQQQQRTYGHRQQAANENSSTASPSSHRILFNLDRLPYDLLNAPQPATQQQLLELQKAQRSQQQQPQQQQQNHHNHQPQQQTLTYQQQSQQQQQQHHHNINPCLESAVSSLFSSSTLSAHPALIKQRQQHSSLSDQQHSNQNAKGLPNGDLVRCVAEISNTATASTNDGANDGAGVQFTTERSNIEELFTPTPEQNYEIEESVSVMTNGRAHGIQGGGGGRNSFALPTTPPTPQAAAHAFQPNRQRVHFGTKINNGADTGSGGHLSQTYNTNANANGDHHHHQQQSHSPDYNSYDDGDNDERSNDDYGDDDSGRHRDESAVSNGDDEDDSKVAYVVEGRNYRKYRVEEKTDDGFIVGEYGVVDHNDGNLRGVRYTADSTINRSLIQKALLTFLKLK